MPYLQVDLPRAYPSAAKSGFVRALAELYARAMATQPHIPSIALRELAPGQLVRVQDGVPREVAVVMCDVRRGRDAAQREAFARDLCALVATTFAIDPRQVVVEFTQHAADEMFRYGAIAPEWTPSEAVGSD